MQQDVPKFGEFGVYMNNKIEKLAAQNDQMAVKSKIFENLTFHINGDTTPPIQELKTLILENGGKYEQYRLSEVRYFIAEMLSESKKKMWADKIVIKPSFVLESIKHNKLEEYQSHLLHGTEEFIKSFYQQSRLHYLSMWKSELRLWCSKLKRTSERPSTVFIAHVDLDAFFVSASLLNYPQHANKPVAVSHGTNTSSSSADIASCNYVARQYQIKNGMRLGSAKKICPDLIVLPYDFELYKKISRAFYDILIESSDEIESVSCDEAFIDITSHVEDEFDANAFANQLRTKICENTKIQASAGIGHNKLLARIATKKAKPAGEYYLDQNEFIQVIGTYKPDILPGIGRQLKHTMTDNGINTCNDLLGRDLEFLQKTFGKNKGLTIYEMVRGIDKSHLNENTDERQSVSAEINWGIRFKAKQDFFDFLDGLCNQAVSRLQETNSTCEKCVLKLMIRAEGQPIEPTSKYLGHGICDLITFSDTFKCTDVTSVILQRVLKLADRYSNEISDLRGIGIQLLQLKTKTATRDFNAPVKRTVEQDFYETINKSVYDELPSSIQGELYNNWRRERNEDGLVEKLKRARGGENNEPKNKGFPQFDGCVDRVLIVDKINDWITKRQNKGPPSAEDKDNILSYLNELIVAGYCDFATEIINLIKYLTAFKSWANEFHKEWKDINKKIQSRYSN